MRIYQPLAETDLPTQSEQASWWHIPVGHIVTLHELTRGFAVPNSWLGCDHYTSGTQSLARSLQCIALVNRMMQGMKEHDGIKGLREG